MNSSQSNPKLALQIALSENSKNSVLDIGLLRSFIKILSKHLFYVLNKRENINRCGDMALLFASNVHGETNFFTIC